MEEETIRYKLTKEEYEECKECHLYYNCIFPKKYCRMRRVLRQIKEAQKSPMKTK